MEVQEEATQALGYLILGKLVPNANMMAQAVAAGAVPILMGLLRTSGSSAEALRRDVAATLGQLIFGAQPEFTAAGAIEDLVSLLKSGSKDTQSAASLALVNLCHGNKAARTKVADALPLLAYLHTAAGSEAMWYNAEELLQALTAGASPLDDPDKGSPSALGSTAASVHPASGSQPSTSAAALPPANASPQQQQQQSQQPLRPRKSCWSCGATGMPLKKCSVCAVVAYCGA